MTWRGGDKFTLFFIMNNSLIAVEFFIYHGLKNQSEIKSINFSGFYVLKLPIFSCIPSDIQVCPLTGDDAVAQLYKITISFCVLLFSALSVTPLALASGQTPPAASSKSPQTKNISDRKTRLNSKQAKAPRAQVAKTSVNKTSAALSKERQTKRTSEQKSQARQSTKPLAARQTAKITNQCPQRKGDKKQCAKSAKASAKPMPVAMNNARKNVLLVKVRTPIAKQPAKNHH